MLLSLCSKLNIRGQWALVMGEPSYRSAFIHGDVGVTVFTKS